LPSSLISTYMITRKSPEEARPPGLAMEIEPARCECCGLREDCTLDYIRGVTAEFGGTWLCGLCAEAVRDELDKGRRKKKAASGYGVEEATRAHMTFCRKFRSNPAVGVADGMRQILRRRSGDMSMSSSAPRRHGRPAAGAAQVGDDPSTLPF
ncbi:hypothetical protein Taro_038177, partial [Colocasia esculenta]|nr:hypothetical protein [Colocasia esculenta]